MEGPRIDDIARMGAAGATIGEYAQIIMNQQQTITLLKFRIEELEKALFKEADSAATDTRHDQ